MKNTNEQLLELSKLLDNKRITQEEFDVLKKELLKEDTADEKELDLGTKAAIAGVNTYTLFQVAAAIISLYFFFQTFFEN